MKIGKNSVVTLEYTLHLGDGEVVDASDAGDPFVYLHGGGQIVPGLEAALDGLAVGDTRQVVVSPADGYGDSNPEAVQEVSRSAFPEGAELAPGVVFAAEDDSGHVIEFRVLEVKEESVVIDANHPLAGETLHFDVKVQSVRAATAEELAHGHAHGAHGHGHGHDHGHGHEH